MRCTRWWRRTKHPFFSPRLRARVYGSWYMYQASDVGQPNANFDGDGWSVGAEFIWNFLQIEDRFVDFVGGVRNDRLRVNNELADVSGHDNLFLGYTGLRYERTGVASSSRASVMFEFSLDGLKSDSVNDLGRFDASRNWQTVNLAAEQSFFLEPLLNPDLDEDSSLVHEFVLTGRGQLAFNHRLIPNYEQVAGGLFTVRGYDEAVVAGDTTFIGSFEYRFHLPRSFAPRRSPPSSSGRRSGSRRSTSMGRWTGT